MVGAVTTTSPTVSGPAEPHPPPPAAAADAQGNLRQSSSSEESVLKWEKTKRWQRKLENLSKQTVAQDKGGGVNKKLGGIAMRCSNEAIARDDVSRTESRLLKQPFQTWIRCKETHLKWLCGWFPQ